MNADVINAFTGAVKDVLSQEMGEPIDLGDARLQGGPYQVGDITVVVGLAQRIEGAVLLGISQSTAKQYLSSVLGEAVEELDELALSGIAELGNMIAGSAGVRLAELGYETVIAPPTVFMDGGTISTLNLPRLVVPVTSPCGVIDLQLAARIHA
jgi:CheY-specific phosphatase CheX